MSDRTIPDRDHLSRYCKPSTVDDGLPTASAFELRPGEDHLSVNWLEYFAAPDLATAVHLVRSAFHDKAYRLRPGGRFAVFPCGAAKIAVSDGTGRPGVSSICRLRKIHRMPVSSGTPRTTSRSR